ncbi:hypothetical protein ONS96_009504 [Cadophora gregata f. sp. sojae]|nr:hypothetical protein ONS96_009504 [Cadophora gregata f. sp. sojae]
MNNFFNAQYHSQYQPYHQFYTEQDPRAGASTCFRHREEEEAAAYDAHMKKVAEQEEQEKVRKQRRAEQQAKREKERAEKAAREEKKKAEEIAKQEANEKTASDEKDRQEKIWKDNNANTAEEKRATCLHASFWPKHQGKSKYKCMGCNQKRGPTGFKCPHCELLQCQACLNNFNKNRPAS